MEREEALEVLRGALLGRARAAGVHGEDETAALEALLAREVVTPEPTDAECRRVYERHRGEFVRGELAEVSHVLFAVLEGAPVEAIRAQAERTLRVALADPPQFAALARSFSNCPSAAVGGSLGQVGRGDTVPEFERAVFGAGATWVLPALVRTRFGFHVVLLERRIPGQPMAFEDVRDAIAARLRERVEAKALRQYLEVLAAEGALPPELFPAARSPLVQ
jgi:peptidyl-prolyl cis-trans isomerase C